ncbi:MAG: helix-turn-helix domain-containing protein [Myxococcaceae bacterium]|nr:MAG: helix-turn-helix domain-containing protein [Myxococcaceae bacterium]
MDVSDDLLTAKEAAILLGLSDATIRRAATDGELRVASQTARGGPLFTREDLEVYAAARAAGGPPGSPPPAAASPSEPTPAGVRLAERLADSLLRYSDGERRAVEMERRSWLEQRTADRLMFEQLRAGDRAHLETVVSGLRETNALLIGQLQQARARVSELEARSEEIVRTREDLLNERALRDLMVEKERAEQKRMDAGLRTLQDYAPVVAAKFGLGSVDAPSADLVSTLKLSEALFSKLSLDDLLAMQALITEKHGEQAGLQFQTLCEKMHPVMRHLAEQEKGAPKDDQN